MTSITESMALREKGAYQISIGTSLALEAAFGHYPDLPIIDPPPISSVQNLWINLRTLIRNYLGAMALPARETIHADDLIMGIQEEMTILESAVASGSHGMCNVVFYVCDYSRVISKFSNAWLRTAKTPKQRASQALEAATVKAIINTPLSQDLRKFNFELVSSSRLYPPSYIITHLPIDLLSRSNFESLSLLESHTGAIKHPGLWNTKLTTGKEHAQLPFNRFTLQLFGDNGAMFHPAPGHLRDQILRLSLLDGWTPVTTTDKIRWSIGHVPNDIERGQLLGLM